jgi:dTDP-4-dehydrorhamnose reductase
MHVLITGAGGQLARALLAAAPATWRCRGLTRRELDLADPDAARALIYRLRPDVLINAAAYTAVDAAQSDPEAAMQVNGIAVGVLAEAMADLGGRLVQVSSDYVFDGETSRPYRPDDARRPLSAYGRSKALGEDRAGEDALIVRTAWLYTARGRNFLHTMLAAMRAGGEVRVVADQIGAPTWAPRLAQVIWRLVAADERGVHHYADAGVASWYDFAVAIAEEARALGLLACAPCVTPIAAADYPRPAPRPRVALLDTRGALAASGLAPVHWRVNLRSALAELAQTERGYD